MTDSLLYAELPQHLKRSINLAYLENGIYEQINTHLKGELDLSGLEADEELPFPTMTSTTTLNKQTQPQNAEQQQIFCRYSQNQVMSSRNAENAFAKSNNDKVESNFPIDHF